jgi:5-methylcytosine-specific restriction endonuclease McrA
MSRLDPYRTLLLDATWNPVRAISWKRAVILDMQDRVDVVEYYDEVIHTPNRDIPLPAVIRLRQYLKVFSRGVSFTRRNVLLRDAFECQYCGARPGTQELTLDHVVPRSRGGGMSWDNVVTACKPCNHVKGSRTPREAAMELRRLPRKPLYLPVVRPGIEHEETPREWLGYLRLATG